MSEIPLKMMTHVRNQINLNAKITLITNMPVLSLKINVKKINGLKIKLNISVKSHQVQIVLLMETAQKRNLLVLSLMDTLNIVMIIITNVSNLLVIHQLYL
jgi:hypothetical protein